MVRRNTQWLKGFELFDPQEKDVSNEIKELERLLSVTFPDDVDEYFEKYIPLNLFEDSSYNENVIITNWAIINRLRNGNMLWHGEPYNLDGILNTIKAYNNSSLSGIHRRLKILPIASNFSSDGDIVLLLDDEKKGKIFDLADYQCSPIDSTTLLAENIYEFINGIEIVPWDVMMELTKDTYN